ncbi:MAG: divergent polysaccharide deacetylase family protein [Hyphomonadaceae bacterium]
MAISLSVTDFIRGWSAPKTPTAMSLGVIGATAVLAVGLIQVLGDPRAAGPSRIIPLDGSGGGAFRTPLSKVVLDSAEASAATEAESGALDGYDEAHADAGAANEDPASTGPAALTQAPIAKISAPGPLGPLPAIAADGSTALKVYRRPYAGDPQKPRVAVIIGGLGFNAAVTQAAIDELPPEVTLSFIPYADNLQGWINQARARGHEVMIDLPMESFDSAESDTGPQTLLAGAPPKDNVGHLENLLSRGAGYFAVSNYQGAKFAQSSQASATLARALKQRGLGMIANGIGPRAALGAEADRAKLPYATADRLLDAQRDSDAIANRLDDLETIAKQTGDALGAGFAFPVTVGEIKTWAAQLPSRGLSLAPASAVLESRSPRP